MGTLTIELTDETVKTCAGEWKKVRLIQSSFPSFDQQFKTREWWPTYRVFGEETSVQLNAPGLCDAWRVLNGKFAARDGSGDYTAVGRGGPRPLGTFTAKKL